MVWYHVMNCTYVRSWANKGVMCIQNLTVKVENIGVFIIVRFSYRCGIVWYALDMVLNFPIMGRGKGE